jgi:hypothetical protein
MKILRTDGGGESFTNERLRTLRKMLIQVDINNIYLLHDHKGILTVVWHSLPNPYDKQKVEIAWAFLNEYEIEHKIVTFENL